MRDAAVSQMSRLWDLAAPIKFEYLKLLAILKRKRNCGNETKYIIILLHCAEIMKISYSISQLIFTLAYVH